MYCMLLFKLKKYVINITPLINNAVCFRIINLAAASCIPARQLVNKIFTNSS